MRNVRIYVADLDGASRKAILLGQAAKHVVRVLRMKTGQSLTVFDGLGHEYPATIAVGTAARVDLEIGAEVKVDRESSLGLTLAVALARGERMDFVMQKATELGVDEIVPLTSARSVVQLGAERAAKRQQHWQRIIISACEQCGRNRLPLVQPVVGLSEWVQALPVAADDEIRLLADPHGGRRFNQGEKSVRKLTLMTGPEGGFTAAESALAAAQGFTSVLLGPRILRAETAAIAMLAVMQWELGDLSH